MTPESPEATRSEPDERSPAPRLRWRRWLVRIFILLLIAVPVLGWLSTTSLVLRPIVRELLEERTGGTIALDRASMSFDGTLTIEGLQLSTDALDGDAGEILTLGLARVSFDGHPLLNRSAAITDVVVRDTRLRLSESEQDDGALNISALEPDWSSDPDGGPTVPPRVEIRNLILENGWHEGSTYTKRSERRLSGEIHPAPAGAAPGWLHYTLGEVDENGIGLATGGLLLKGEWNLLTNEHTTRVDDLVLDEHARSLCPEIARRWWNEMQLAGRVREAKLTYREDEPLSMELDVENVELTIPVDAEGVWARFRDGRIESTPSRPRLRVTSGTIRLDADELVLDQLRGEFGVGQSDANVAPVPYELRMTLPIIGQLDWDDRTSWVRQVLDAAPFELTFTMDGFQVRHLEGGDSEAVDLPLVVARALERFQMSGWELETFVRVSREEPDVAPDGTLIPKPERSEGTAFIANARCQYDKFPYPLQDVNAQLEFKDTDVTVHSITGRGPQSGQFRMAGTIYSVDTIAGVDLSVHAQDIPFDDYLLAALPESTDDTLRSLMHEESFESLVESGVIDEESRLATIDAELASARERVIELRQLDDADSESVRREIAALQQRVERLHRTREAGAFRVGGQVDLALKIERAVGRDQPTITTGRITIDRAGLLLEAFPYPLQIVTGALDWTEERMTVVEDETSDGVRVTTPGGGSGLITGYIDLPPPGVRDVPATPELFIRVDGDSVNPALIAAIPPSRDEREDGTAEGWPGFTASRTAQIVERLGVQGTLDYSGPVTGDDGGLSYRIALGVSGATVEPRPEFLELLDDDVRPWPESLRIENASAILELSNAMITMSSLDGEHATGAVHAEGRLGVGADPTRSFTIDLDSIQLHRGLLNVVPRSILDQVEELWEHYDPQGTVDVSIEYSKESDDAPAAASLSIVPRAVDILVAGERLALEHRAGALEVSADGIQFAGLELQVRDSTDTPGMITLQTDGAPSSEGLPLSGQWTGGSVQSPIVREILDLANADGVEELWDDIQPRGMADAAFTIARDPETDGLAYSVECQPRQLQVLLNDTVVDASFEDGTITLTPGRIEFTTIAGRHAGGAFELDGHMVHGDRRFRANLRIGYEGDVRHEQFAALIPSAANEALEAIQFRDLGTTELRNTRVLITRAPIAGEPLTSTVFKSTLVTDDATFTTGVPFTNVRGPFTVSIEHETGQSARMMIEANLRRATALGHRLRNATAEISLNEDASMILLNGFRAEAYGGTITADAESELGATGLYRSTVQLAHVGLAQFADHARLPGTETTLDDPSLAPADTTPSSSTSGIAADGGHIYAELRLSGRAGDPGSRVGRGKVRIHNGDFGTFTAGLRMVQVLSLVVPVGNSWNFLDLDFFVDGELVQFESILLESRTVMLRGSGTMELPSTEMRLDLRSRGTLAVVKDIVGAISDQLFRIEVTGPLQDLKSRLITLPGLRR